VAVSGLVASERAPGLFVAPDIEIPDDAVLGANVVIHPGVVIGAGCVLQDGAVLGKRLVLSRHTTTPAASTGEATTVLEPGAQVGCHAVIVAGASLGPGAVVGDHSLIRERARLDAASMIGHGGVIGRDCRIGARSKLMAGAILGHDMVFEEDVFCGPGLSVTDDHTMGRHHGVELPFVRLRRACRVGANVTLMTGLEIGEEAVVGAGSVVTKDVAARTVVFGVPARFVREVTDAELRERHPPADRSRA
jgi:UDP-2-acetamido-3-amino-2,3-dideoxy-glucuronate N-acetyltransferase